MDAQLIVDGRVVELNEADVSHAFERLETASDGSVLVALSYDGRVLVRWIDESEAESIASVINVAQNKRARRAQPATKKRCPWLYDSVETEFDHVVTEHGESLEELHASVREDMETRGKRPESYRRWLSKLKKRWVRTVVTHGRRVDDLETLVSGS